MANLLYLRGYGAALPPTPSTPGRRLLAYRDGSLVVHSKIPPQERETSHLRLDAWRALRIRLEVGVHCTSTACEDPLRAGLQHWFL
jgi:hypothetical protein